MLDFLDPVLSVLAEPGWRIWVGSILCVIGGISTVIASVGVHERNQ